MYNIVAYVLRRGWWVIEEAQKMLISRKGLRLSTEATKAFVLFSTPQTWDRF